MSIACRFVSALACLAVISLPLGAAIAQTSAPSQVTSPSQATSPSQLTLPDDLPGATCWTPWGVGTRVDQNDPILKPSADGPPPIVKPDPAYVAQVLRFSDEMLTALSEKSSPTDTQYYENGLWHFKMASAGDEWMFGAGPAGLAASLWQYRNAHPESMDAAAVARQPWLQKVALETFDQSLKEHLLPTGDFSDLASHREFFTVDWVTTYLIFKDVMDPSMKASWLKDMASAVQFMEGSGDLMNPDLEGWKATDGWYINGNVELAKAEFLYLVYQATGEQKYKDLFELQWHHTLAPAQTRWKGYGLYYLSAPTKPDGSDGVGFVSEAAGAPGFDREYGLLQLSIASRLYIESRDARVLRLTNALINGLLPHVNPKTYILNALYGSRHSTLPPFGVCAPAVLNWLGGRSDLSDMLPDQWTKGVAPELKSNAEQNNGAPGMYRAYGYDLAAIIQAAYAAQK